MPERIEKPEINDSVNYEQTKEKGPDVRKFKAVERVDDLKREEALSRAYAKEAKDDAPKVAGKRAGEGDKTVGGFVKEFYSIGVKAIEKAKRVLNPHDIDSLHDTITNRNKGNKDASR